MVWRFTAPILYEMDDGSEMLRECPVGAVLREAPHVYDAIRASSYAESGGLEIMRQSRCLQDAVVLASSEKERLRELKRADEQSARDAKHGAAVLRGRR